MEIMGEEINMGTVLATIVGGVISSIIFYKYFAPKIAEAAARKTLESYQFMSAYPSDVSFVRER